MKVAMVARDLEWFRAKRRWYSLGGRQSWKTDGNGSPATQRYSGQFLQPFFVDKREQIEFSKEFKLPCTLNFKFFFSHVSHSNRRHDPVDHRVLKFQITRLERALLVGSSLGVCQIGSQSAVFCS